MTVVPGPPRVVIIGAGFGGLDAARTFAGDEVELTILDRHNYHLFQPLLYQVATAALSAGDIASPIRWVLRRQRNARVLLAEARAVELASSRVVLDDGTIEYDYLIIAVGSAETYFGHAEWAAYAPGLKTLDDALDIRRRVLLAFERAERTDDPREREGLLTFVIVGGGPTGVELAGALAEIARQTLREDFRRIHPEAARIVLLEGGSSVLGSFPASLGQAARKTLTELGVDVRTGAVVTGVDAGGVTVGGERLGAGTVLWAAGVGASPLVRSLRLPLDRAGRVLAEPDLSLPGRPQVFVAGDICGLQQDGRPLPGVAQVAKQEGVHAAKNVRHLIRSEPTEPFRYHDYGIMATIGRGKAVAAIGPIRTSGFTAWLLWLFVHLMALVGFRNRVAVLSEWAWAYLTYQRRIRLITAPRAAAPESPGSSGES